jgi:acyl-CoA synthetase (AMP-forming)/AMP-acid ligase II
VLPIDLIYAARTRTPDAAAVETPQQTLSYAELVDRVDALAAGLQALDPTPGSRVAICARNTVEHLISLLAVMAAEKTWVPLNPRDAPGELDSRVAVTRPTVVIVDDDCRDRLAPPDATVIIGRGGDAGAHDTVAGIIDRERGRSPARGPRHAEETQAIKFTGGSSGRPKGVLQPYRAWMTGATCMIHGLGLGSQDRYLVAAPLTHGTSCYVTPILATGGTMVLGEGDLNPAAVLDAFTERAITTTFIPPTVIYMMLAELGGEARSFPALRRLIYGGAPMPPDRIAAAQQAFGPVLATNYGQTEAPQVVTYLGPAELTDARNLASVGRASLLTRIGIVDGDGNTAGPGVDGEVVIKGGLIMSGYLDMAELTAETITDGWLHTGDGGVVDERGYLFLKDRLRDVIISGGFNVYPSDVEAAIVRHPAVHECVVFGIPDEKWGEAVQVAVQLKPDAGAGEDDIVAFSKRELGSVKAPKRVHFYDDLPRSGVGKVLRREVRAKVLAAAEKNP